MTDIIDRLKTALAERYQIEREIGEGGMATVLIGDLQSAFFNPTSRNR